MIVRIQNRWVLLTNPKLERRLLKLHFQNRVQELFRMVPCSWHKTKTKVTSDKMWKKIFVKIRVCDCGCCNLGMQYWPSMKRSGPNSKASNSRCFNCLFENICSKILVRKKICSKILIGKKLLENTCWKKLVCNWNNSIWKCLSCS
jgi:hypothetical protein